ncbi:hypothetical protein NDU88_010806 [Pleurodeles waltl]|uniref:Uncharacterized protein n=1 Tax=Pleurodeles waltl TaxID=8319 RepID=A0AAV7PZG8_PLEWA|nr:hypothetical protein NDU88_010806 [Pleurodeles waltl]
MLEINPHIRVTMEDVVNHLRSVNTLLTRAEGIKRAAPAEPLSLMWTIPVLIAGAAAAAAAGLQPLAIVWNILKSIMKSR